MYLQNVCCSIYPNIYDHIIYKCHVKHFTSGNGKGIVDRCMKPWPYTTCEDGIQLGYGPLERNLFPLEKLFRASFWKYQRVQLMPSPWLWVQIRFPMHSKVLLSFNFVKCLMYEVWPVIVVVTVWLFLVEKSLNR